MPLRDADDRDDDAAFKEADGSFRVGERELLKTAEQYAEAHTLHGLNVS